MVISYSLKQLLHLRRLWICILAIMIILPVNTVHAYTLYKRVWPSSYTTYTKDTSYTNQGSGWNSMADNAASDWNGTGLFSFGQSSTSVNHLKAASLAGQTALAVMQPYFTGSYRSNFDITVNLCCGYPYYDGTQSPSLPENYYDLRTILRHEFGHGLGLYHSFAASLMYATLDKGVIRGIDADAQNGAGYLYNPNYTGPLPEGPFDGNAIAYTGTYDGTDTKIGYRGGGWVPGTNVVRAYNATASWSNETKAKAWLHFYGSRITWHFSEASNRSTATIFIDGVDKGTFNLTETLLRRQMAKTWELTNDFHFIEVRANGSGNTGFADVDAFTVNIPIVAGGIRDNSDGQFKYIGTWTHNTATSGAYNSTASWSNITEDAVTFTFQGTGVTYWFSKAANRGYASVSIDGEYYYLVDLYSPTTIRQQNFNITGLPNGVHTIHVEVSGIKKAEATNYYVDVDAMTATN